VLGAAGAIAGDTAMAVSTTGGGVLVPDANPLDVGDRFTIEAWIRRAVINRQAGLFNRGSGSFNLFFDAANRLVLHKAGAAVIVTSTAQLTDQTAFHHVAVTKDGPAVALYLDGVNVTGPITPATLGVNTGALALGAGGFGGTVDEVALYGHALSAARIAAHVAAR
jgi:hypothetical protein